MEYYVTIRNTKTLEILHSKYYNLYTLSIATTLINPVVITMVQCAVSPNRCTVWINLPDNATRIIVKQIDNLLVVEPEFRGVE